MLAVIANRRVSSLCDRHVCSEQYHKPIVHSVYSQHLQVDIVKERAEIAHLRRLLRRGFESQRQLQDLGLLPVTALDLPLLGPASRVGMDLQNNSLPIRRWKRPGVTGLARMAHSYIQTVIMQQIQREVQSCCQPLWSTISIH